MVSAVQTAPGFDHDEEAVAVELGIDRERIHALRAKGSLLEGSDWVKKGGRVRLSAVGLAKAMTILAVPSPVSTEIRAPAVATAAERGKKTPLALLGDGTVEIVFVRGARSPHMAIGTYGGAQVTIRLKTWTKLRRGMVMRCRQVGPNFYELAQKCPRYAGRW